MFLKLALYTFCVMALEIVLLFVESILYGTSQIYQLGIRAVTIHWSVTYLLWGVGALLLCYYSKKKGFNLLAIKATPSAKSLFIVAALFITKLLLSLISFDFRLKPFVEYITFMKLYANLGVLAFILQYIYYAFEALLILLSIVFGQKAGEILFIKVNIPWGGLFLALTWGLVHIFTGTVISGLFSMVCAIIFGTTFLLLKNNIRYAYPIIFFMFIL